MTSCSSARACPSPRRAEASAPVSRACPGACSDDALKAAQIARGLSTTSVVLLHGLEKPGALDGRSRLPQRQQQSVRQAESSDDLWNLILERTNRLLASVGVEPDMSDCRHSVQTLPETAGTPTESSLYSQEEPQPSVGGIPQLDYNALQRSPLLLPPAVRRPPVAECGAVLAADKLSSRSSSPASSAGLQGVFGSSHGEENPSEVAGASPLASSPPSSCSAPRRTTAREVDLEDYRRPSSGSFVESQFLRASPAPSGSTCSRRNYPDSPDSSGWYCQGTDRGESCGMIRMASVGSFRKIAAGDTSSCDSFGHINVVGIGGMVAGGSAVIAVAPRSSGAQSEGDTASCEARSRELFY